MLSLRLQKQRKNYRRINKSEHINSYDSCLVMSIGRFSLFTAIVFGFILFMGTGETSADSMRRRTVVSYRPCQLQV